MDAELIFKIMLIIFALVGLFFITWMEIIEPIIEDKKKKDEPQKENTFRVYTVPGNAVKLYSKIAIDKNDGEISKSYIEDRLVTGFLNNEEFKNCLLFEREDNPIDPDRLIYRATLVVVKYPKEKEL